MQLSTEEFLTLQGSMSRKDADNALLQREIERLTGEVKRLSDENERLRACQAGASPAGAGKPGYVLLSIDAVCNLFRNIRNVKFVSFLYLVCIHRFYPLLPLYNNLFLLLLYHKS